MPNTTTTPRPLLRETQAAELLDMSPRTLELWRRAGSGPRFVKVGRSVRYRPEDLDAFVSERVRVTTAGA